MKFLLSLQGKILGLFISLIIIFAGSLYFIFPRLGIKLLETHVVLFVFAALALITLVALLIFFLTERHYKKLKIEKQKTNTIINRYDAINIATNDAIWDHDLVTGKTFYNQRVLQIFGYSKQDLSNNQKWWMDNIHPDDIERVQQKINEVLQNDQSLWQDEYRFRCKDETYKIVADRSFIVRNKEGKPIRLIGAMNDKTGERVLQQKMMQEKLDYKNNLGRAIIQAHEDERKKIREQLHEDVNQVLASVKMHMNSLIIRPGENTTQINQSLLNLEDAIKKIKKISNYLAPSAMEYFGLLPAVTDLVLDMQKRNPLTTIHFYAGLFDESKVDAALKNLIYRSVQDSFSCIFQQKNITVVWVNLQNTNNNICLLIKFDGAITNPQLRDLHLKELKNKLELYNGRLNICLQEDQYNLMEIYL